LDQTEESPTSSRLTWPEGGGLKGKDTPEDVPEGGGLKRKSSPERDDTSVRRQAAGQPSSIVRRIGIADRFNGSATSRRFDESRDAQPRKQSG
jgi:hypothetical protein